jgi:hypothetical protein
MMAEGKYAIRIYTDIEKDATEEVGYQKPIVLVNNVYLSLPNTHLLILMKTTTTAVKSPSFTYKPATSVTKSSTQLPFQTPKSTTSAYTLLAYALHHTNPVLPHPLQFLFLHQSLAFPFHPPKEKPRPLKKRSQPLLHLPLRKTMATFARSANAPTCTTTLPGLRARPTVIPVVARRMKLLLLPDLFRSHHALTLPLQRLPLLNKRTQLLLPDSPENTYSPMSATISLIDGPEVIPNTSVLWTPFIMITTLEPGSAIGKG